MDCIRLNCATVRDTRRTSSLQKGMKYPTTHDIDRSRGYDCSITMTVARRAYPTIERSLADSSGCALKSPFNLLQGVSGSHAASSHAADLPPCWGLYMCAQRAPWESAKCDVTVVAHKALYVLSSRTNRHITSHCYLLLNALKAM